ncbi:histone-lysine N-methyltransferase SETMAR-like [Cardiocondyla obscurior]|uniref:histone-lysine N-methyltransferase SETMAR-like n=1 Tax=Cardiocondyla obscurior TaxID=286306 RepID=UPI0039656831
MAHENALEAARIYRERFPNRAHPTVGTILRCVRRARNTGFVSVQRQQLVQFDRGVRRNINREEAILNEFENDPTNSVRRVAENVGVSRQLVHRVIREDGLHPFHYQRVQHLLPRDQMQRAIFCQAQCRQDETFPDNILWSDEAIFTPNGIFNSKNFIMWQHQNPHAVRQCAFQFRWKLNVWAGIIGNRVVNWSVLLPPRLDERYAQFLENHLPILLEELPLQMQQTMIFQHDGAPPHYSRRARMVLDRHFPDRWIGRNGPWPARSPDLNVLDYFVWGYIKNRVENVRDRNVEEVRENIIAAFNTITPNVAHRATRQIIQRARLCIQQQGNHFEQLMH